MDRLSVYAKSVRVGIVSTILASAMLAAVILGPVTPTRAAQSDDDATLRHLVQYFVGVGQQQYDRGCDWYIEAETTLKKARDYIQYLDPVEQRKLQSLLERVSAAAAGRRQAMEARQNAQDLLRKGDVTAARAHLAGIKDSEFLTAKERAEVAEMLRGKDQTAQKGTTGVPAPVGKAAAVAPSPSQTQRGQSAAGDMLERYKSGIAQLYQESLEAYQSGDHKTAKEGFTRVLRSGLMPPATVEAIGGYLARIDASQAKPGDARPVVLQDEPAALAAVGVSTPTNTPANFHAQGEPAAQPGEQERIKELYDRGLELLIKGDLVAARQHMEEVERSGLYSTAPEGERPEDLIAMIDRHLAARQGVQPPAPQPGPGPVAEPNAVPPAAAVPAAPVAAQPGGEEGGFIEEINRRRNIIRGRTETVVNDSVAQAQRLMAQGEFDGAMRLIDSAMRVVNENHFYLGEDLFRQYGQRLNAAADRIREAQSARERQLADIRRVEAVEAERELRQQAEIDRQRRIDELLERAKAYWKQQQYEAALGQLEALLAIDRLHDEALTLKQMVEDMIYLRKQLELTQLSNKQRTDIFLQTEEASVPYADEITYPKEWRELIQRPTRQPEKPIQLDPANVRVYEQLDTIVDLSMLSPEMPVSEAIEALRRSVDPPLNIVVLWRDLLDNADIDPSSSINIDAMTDVELRTALESLLSAISNPLYPDYPVQYVVNRGVITVATVAGLPERRMETRVYDISDLVGEPANYAQMGQMMGMMGGMGGMGGGMMGGMGGMGGYGGGMMGGMGGYGGGMTGGMGGMGGYGGGMTGGMGGMGGGMMGGMGGMGGSGGGLMGGMGGMGGGMMGGMGGMGGYGGGMMGGMGGYGGGMTGGMGGMGGYGGGMMGGMGGMGGYGGGMMGGMGGYGGGMMGGYGGMGGGAMAYSLRQLIQESINPETWYELYPDDPDAQGAIMVFPDQLPKKLAVYQTAEVHGKIEDLLDQLRKSLGHEVSIEARFLTVTENFLEDIGLDLDFTYNLGGKWGVLSVNQGSFLSAGPDITTRVPGSLGQLRDDPAANITGGYGSILDDLQVSLLVRATQGRADSKALAAPKVTVMSGEGASFTLYDTIVYALPNTQMLQTAVGGIGAGVQQQGIQPNIGSLPVGSQLSITPTITKDKKYVLLNIVSQQIDLLRFRVLQVTSTNPNTTAGAPPTVTVPVTLPETETASVATRVSVPDRGTLLLGGHKLTAEVEKEVGVPVLNKIPILKILFSNRSKIRDEKVLLILVKPTIILQEETEQEAIAAMEQVIAPAR